MTLFCNHILEKLEKYTLSVYNIYCYIYKHFDKHVYCITMCPSSISCNTDLERELSFFLFFFLSPHLQHMEVPRLDVKSELQLLAKAIATATRDPSHICNLYHSSRQRWIFNPLSKARDRTRNLMVPSRIR